MARFGYYEPNFRNELMRPFAQSGNPGYSVLQPGLPDWAGKLLQSGNTGLWLVRLLKPDAEGSAVCVVLALRERETVIRPFKGGTVWTRPYWCHETVEIQTSFRPQRVTWWPLVTSGDPWETKGGKNGSPCGPEAPLSSAFTGAEKVIRSQYLTH